MANTKGVADHKAANTTTIPGLTVERTKSIVLLLVQLFSVVQTGLSIAGISQLPFTSDQVEHGDHRRHRRHRQHLLVVAQ